MKNILKTGALALVVGAIIVPATANAQNWRREETANEWRNIATVGGLVSVLGALNHDDTLTFVGAAGALYAGYRFNEDMKSSDPCRHARAVYFDRDYFYRDGCRYERRKVWHGGEWAYQFVNVDYGRRHDDWGRDDARRRDEERRERERFERARIEEQRRREAEERRWREEERRREDARRREEQRRRDEERRERERWERDHRDRDRNRDHDRDRDHDRGRGHGDH